MQIVGPAGALEARLDEPDKHSSMTAILAHPHPQYGGSMHDPVLQTAADVCLGLGMNVVRFNFRGVGASTGTFDQGKGEADDLRSVHNWVLERHPNHAICWIGYSFGAAMAWHAMSQQPQENLSLLLLLAPPLMMIDTNTELVEGSSVYAIAGDQDNYVDSQQLRGWKNVEPTLIAGADHFFSGYHDELAKQINVCLERLT